MEKKQAAAKDYVCLYPTFKAWFQFQQAPHFFNATWGGGVERVATVARASGLPKVTPRLETTSCDGIACPDTNTQLYQAMTTMSLTNLWEWVPFLGPGKPLGVRRIREETHQKMELSYGSLKKVGSAACNNPSNWQHISGYISGKCLLLMEEIVKEPPFGCRKPDLGHVMTGQPPLPD